MGTKRGDNVGAGLGLKAVVDSSFEMECFERLGPRTRAMIAASPIKILAAPIVADIEKAARERNVTYDFNNPGIDAAIAKGIREQTFKLLKLERGEVEALAGITQLKLRPGARRRSGRRMYR